MVVGRRGEKPLENEQRYPADAQPAHVAGEDERLEGAPDGVEGVGALLRWDAV